MTDVAFWSLAYALWLKDPPSEYHRVEVIYDVLLPWLVEGEKGDQTVTNCMISTSNSDPYATWKTPARANTGSFRCVYAGFQYILRTMGISTPQLKQLGFILRAHFLQWAGEDLVARYGRRYPAAENAVKEAEALGINPPPESKQEGEEQQEEKPPTLTQTDIKLLQIASGQLALTAVKENEAERLSRKALPLCKKSIDAI